ncbi:MAG TPA: hypothetical protein VIV60_00820 [Polyangiaceae bacterium]
MRVEEIGTGMKFRTRLTHRVGEVLGVRGTEETLVRWSEDGRTQYIHNGVEVDADGTGVAIQ